MVPTHIVHRKTVNILEEMPIYRKNALKQTEKKKETKTKKGMHMCSYVPPG